MAEVFESLAGVEGTAALGLDCFERYLVRRTDAAAAAWERIGGSRPGDGEQTLAALRALLQDWAAPAAPKDKQPDAAAPGGPGGFAPRAKAPGGPLTATPASTPAGSRRPSGDRGVPRTKPPALGLAASGAALPARVAALRLALEPVWHSLERQAVAALEMVGQRLPPEDPLPRRYWAYREKLLAEQVGLLSFGFAPAQGECASEDCASVVAALLRLAPHRVRRHYLQSLRPGSADLVALLMDLHHVLDGPARAVDAAARPLRRGGWLLVWDYDCRTEAAALAHDAMHAVDCCVLGGRPSVPPGGYLSLRDPDRLAARCGLGRAAEARVPDSSEYFVLYEKL
jgi:hypothetical protein